MTRNRKQWLNGIPLLFFAFLVLGAAGPLPGTQQPQESSADQISDALYRELNGIERALHREIRQIQGSKQYTTPLDRLKAKYDLSPRSHPCPVYFGQASVQPRFSTRGKFQAASFDDVIAMLKAATLTPDDLPVEFIWVNGIKVTINNRSLTVLYRIGKRPTKLIDRTGNLPAEGPDTMEDVLRRLEGMDGKPSTEMLVRTRGLGRDGLMKDSSDWAAPIGEVVSMPYELLIEAKNCRQSDKTSRRAKMRAEVLRVMMSMSDIQKFLDDVSGVR